MPIPFLRPRTTAGPVLAALVLLAAACSPPPDQKAAPAAKTETAETAATAPAAKPAAAPAPQATTPPPAAPTAAVDWKPYEQGLAEAKATNKPVCLIFYTDWCPHCRNYQKVLADPAVVELSRKFVMIHLNKDENAELSAKYAPDGEYIPRTFFLKSDGTLLANITEQRDQYRYFYDEHDPASVMRSMNAVLALPAS